MNNHFIWQFTYNFQALIFSQSALKGMHFIYIKQHIWTDNVKWFMHTGDICDFPALEIYFQIVNDEDKKGTESKKSKNHTTCFTPLQSICTDAIIRQQLLAYIYLIWQDLKTSLSRLHYKHTHTQTWMPTIKPWYHKISNTWVLNLIRVPIVLVSQMRSVTPSVSVHEIKMFQIMQ